MRLESVIVIVPISVIVSEAAAMDYCVNATQCHQADLGSLPTVM